MKKKNTKKKRTKNEKHEKNSIFLNVFGFVKKWLKNRPFWWPPRFSGGGEPGTTKKEKNIGNNEKKKHENNMKKRKTNETNSFFLLTFFFIFQKWVKNLPFWWPPRLSGGEGREPPKWIKMETLGSLCLQEPPQGKLWGCQKLQNGIFGKPQQIW